MTKIKAAFFNEDTSKNSKIYKVFSQGRRGQLSELTELYPRIVSSDNFDEHVPDLQDVEAVFSTWGMPKLQADQIRQLPALKALFYAAGTVKRFAPPFLDAGIRVVSSRAANAIPVAEFTVAQILLSCKGYFTNIREYKKFSKAHRGPGVYGEKVALIGAGQIGRKVVELLKPVNLRVLMVDPFLNDEQAEAMGVKLVSLDEAFREALVVSNHLPNLGHLKKVLNGPLFQAMRTGATFINTGRGAQVDEDALIKTLKNRPDLTALLDVTHPEPVRPESELHMLSNVLLSTHIAGSINDEVRRMADYTIEEFKRWQDNQPLRYEVTREMLTHMA